MTRRKIVSIITAAVIGFGVVLFGVDTASAASSSSSASKAQATAQKRCGTSYSLGWSAVLRDKHGVAQGDLNVLYKPNEETGAYKECRVITSRSAGKFKVTLKVTRDDGKVLVNKSGTRSTTYTSFGNHPLGHDYVEQASATDRYIATIAVFFVAQNYSVKLPYGYVVSAEKSRPSSHLLPVNWNPDFDTSNPVVTP